MTNWDMRTLTEDVLARASVDWVTPRDVMGVCLRLDIPSREDVRDLAIGLITRLVATRLLIPGDITDSGHQPWDCDPGEAIVRIAVSWDALPDPFEIRTGDIVWLDVSPEGQLIGESVLRRESR